MASNTFPHIAVRSLLASAVVMAAMCVAGTPVTSAEASAKKVQLRLKSPTGSDSEKESRQNANTDRRHLHADSVTLEEVRQRLAFSGFDKPASSRRETFLITNNSTNDIASLTLQIVYSDLDGRMLHSRDEEISTVIPAGETRLATIKSFDPQGTLYYKESRPPKNGGQPFQVDIYLLDVFLTR